MFNRKLCYVNKKSVYTVLKDGYGLEVMGEIVDGVYAELDGISGFFMLCSTGELVRYVDGKTTEYIGRAPKLPAPRPGQIVVTRYAKLFVYDDGYRTGLYAFCEAGGSYESSRNMYVTHSYDGVNWSELTLIEGYLPNGRLVRPTHAFVKAGNNKVYIFDMDDYAVCVSADMINWNAYRLPESDIEGMYLDSDCYVCFADGKIYGVGQERVLDSWRYVILCSEDDGLTWNVLGEIEEYSSENFYFNTYGLDYINGKFILCVIKRYWSGGIPQELFIYSSNDGIVWNKTKIKEGRSETLHCYKTGIYGNEFVVISAYGDVVSSADGIVWTEQTPIPYPKHQAGEWWNFIRYYDNKYLVCGSIPAGALSLKYAAFTVVNI